MKESVLWRRLDRVVGTRLRARYKNKESGVAMVMALMFILVVLLTSTLLLGILLSQALPYRNNARNAQGKVAAEAGLQAGLSFLRTAESYYETGNYDKLMPATAADPSKTSLDETYAVETATASSSATGTAKVVTLNYVPVNDTTSGTTAVSTSSSTHDQKLSYRIQIGYYDGDPNTTGKLVSDATKLSTVKYAVVVSYGYVNRYPDGRTAGTEADPVRTAAAIYKFGQSSEIPLGGGGGGGGSPMRNVPMEDEGAPWIYVASKTTDANGDLDTITAMNDIDESHGNDYNAINGNYIDGRQVEAGYDQTVPDPRDSLCFVATTDTDGNIDPSKSAVEGSAIRLFRQAVQTGTRTLKYSEYCKKNGKYKHLNQWAYGKDDSIRLKGTNLCMTGLDTSYRTLGGGKAQDGAMRLTTCGNSYSPAVSDGKVEAGTGTTWQSQGYDTEAELNDPNSLLNKFQKWGFFLGFVNAGYVNFGKNNTDDANKLYYSRGEMHSNGSDYKHTLFQTMYAQRIANANSLASAKWGQCDANVSSKQYGSDATGGDSCFLISTQWTDHFYDNGHMSAGDIWTYAESLGSGGEAGWNTNQVVSYSGSCMFAGNNGGDIAITKQCFVNAAPSYSYCYSTLLYGKDMDTMSWQYPCPVTSVGVQSKFDNIIYDRGSDGIDGKKLTTLRMTWGQSGNRHDNASSATISYRCLYTDGNSAGSWLKINNGNCPTASTSNNSSFYRFEYVGSKSVYNYKFVLASTYDGKDDDTTNSLCLTEMTNGLTGANYASGDHGNAYFYQVQKYAPKVVLQKCTKSTTNVLGEVSYPQQWNGVRPDGGGGSGGGTSSKSYKVMTTASVSYASSKYVDAANWKW